VNIPYVLQPIVDVLSGDTLHYEVLSRPDSLDDAPSLEHYFENMTPALQLEIIRDQLQHFAVYQIPLAINVSPKLLDCPQQRHALVELIRTHDMPLLLEFTEGSPLPPEEQVNPYLRDLRAVGCQVALDDFGSGYNIDIASIQDYDFDVIKIDRSLSSRWDDPRRKPSLSLLAHLIKTLGKTAIAEGIETQAQADSLQTIGFNRQQGNYHCRPGTLQAIRPAAGI